MGGRNHAALLLKERVMTKTRKFRLVRVGDAKVLTRGDIGAGLELVTMRREQP
jgi:hypothetical protein